jgi:hypothetical protein
MQSILAVSGSIIVAFSFTPYLIDTINGKVKPRISSWSTWSLITGIATVAALSEGAYTSALLTGVTTAVELSVLFFAIKHGDRTYKLIDGICQGISLTGVGAWLLTGNVAWAIIFQIAADLFAAIPTLYHAWIAPHEEAWFSFLLFGLGSVLTVFAVEKQDFINLAFPVEFTLIALAIASTIYFRQKVTVGR